MESNIYMAQQQQQAMFTGFLFSAVTRKMQPQLFRLELIKSVVFFKFFS